MIAVEIVTDGFSFQDYGVGQTAAEYINGAFNGQKGFKASLNHRNTFTLPTEFEIKVVRSRSTSKDLLVAPGKNRPLPSALRPGGKW